jgi:hypothetical protein
MVTISDTLLPEILHVGDEYVRTPKYILKNSVALVRKQTIPTERPPLLGEVNANCCVQRVSLVQRNGSPRPLISVFGNILEMLTNRLCLRERRVSNGDTLK